jgi:hypothetical protein
MQDDFESAFPLFSPLASHELYNSIARVPTTEATVKTYTRVPPSSKRRSRRRPP